MRKQKYQITKKQCQSRIKGVCEGCGRNLKPLKTVNNSGEPTYWIGCKRCSSFRVGIDCRYWEIAKGLIEREEMIPYPHMRKNDYIDTSEHLEYYFASQCAGLSHKIEYIHNLLKEKFLKGEAK